MANDVVVLPDDSGNTGKKIDNESLTVGGLTVLRERFQIAGDSAADIAEVMASDPVGTEYGIVTRPIPAGIQEVDGAVTANAGTNLNTSALALESTMGSVKTSVELIDDTVAVDGSAALSKLIQVGGTDGTNAQILKTDSDGNAQVDVLTLPSVVVSTLPADPMGANADASNPNGSISAKLRYLAADGIAGMTALPTGANAIGKLAANSGVDIGDVDVTTMPATAAHDAAKPAVSLLGGGAAVAGLAGATLVAAGDIADQVSGLDGVQIVRPHAPLEDIVSGNASNTDGTSFSVIAAGGANVKHYLIAFTITNTHATQNIYCEIKDDTTTKWTVPVPANGGVTVNLPIPIPGTANKAWSCDPSAATTTVFASFLAFKSKE